MRVTQLSASHSDFTQPVRKHYSENYTWNTKHKSSVLATRPPQREVVEDFHFNRKRSLKNMSQISFGDSPVKNSTMEKAQNQHFGNLRNSKS
jgi:hypothetical protein